jgi:perosamine synthetase
MSTRAPGPAWPVPRLPVFGWQAWQGGRAANTPCMLDLPNCHLTTSGRASIALALQVLGVHADEPVLLPSYHCPTMVAPAAALGAQPYFYPVDDHGTPDLDWLSAQDLRSARVMLAAHFFGLPQSMSRIRRWCDERGISLIEDCAHALFGTSDGQPIGSWGDVAIGSLTKFLPVPEGGCLVLNHGQQPPRLSGCGLRAQAKVLLDIVEEGARHGRLSRAGRAFTVPLDALRALRTRAPTPAPVTEAPNGQAGAADLGIDMVLATRQLSWGSRALAMRLPRQRIVEQRHRNYALLTRGLLGLEGVAPLLPELPPGTTPYVLPLWVRQPDPGYQALRAERIPVFRWDRLWPNVPDLPRDTGKNWSHHVIQLACHQDLLPHDIDRMLGAVRRHLASSDPTLPFRRLT